MKLNYFVFCVFVFRKLIEPYVIAELLLLTLLLLLLNPFFWSLFLISSDKYISNDSHNNNEYKLYSLDFTTQFCFLLHTQDQINLQSHMVHMDMVDDMKSTYTQTRWIISLHQRNKNRKIQNYWNRISIRVNSVSFVFVYKNKKNPNFKLQSQFPMLTTE